MISVRFATTLALHETTLAFVAFRVYFKQFFKVNFSQVVDHVLVNPHKCLKRGVLEVTLNPKYPLVSFKYPQVSKSTPWGSGGT